MAYEFNSYGQADWFYGINKPAPEFTCPEGYTKEPQAGGFRCLPPAPPPPPPPSAAMPVDAGVPAMPVDAGVPAMPVDAGVPAMPVDAGVPAMPARASSAMVAEDGGIMELLAENWIIVVGGIAVFGAITLLALKGRGRDEEEETPAKPAEQRIVIELPKGGSPAARKKSRQRRKRR